ncbi:hypothetical protein LPJ66_002310 [Kickxella alabastrina]|uniref:Uncharacterized protein n=1 Tax=Kickxella alabastrina TaxID=61397 RepID=A0ACC1IQX4_9FUNG|nr:hypothetical protein LPJ66_002310 [Kickxella alabastrina]
MPITAALDSTIVKPSNIRGVIFDLDGTLISTLQVTEHVYTRHSQTHNIDPLPVIHFCHGIPTLQVLQEFFPATTHTPEYAELIEREAAEMLQGIEVIPGSRELLEALGDKWSIFTSGMPFLALPRMKALGLPIPKVFVTPVDIANGKPNPEGYLLAAQRMQCGADAADCVVFEDAAAGIAAGKSAGALVIGLRTQLSAKQLKAAGATYTIEDMTKVTVGPGVDGDCLALFIDEA